MVITVALLVEEYNNNGEGEEVIIIIIILYCYYQLIIDDDDDTLIGGEDVDAGTCGGRLAKGVPLSEEEDTRASVNTGCLEEKRSVAPATQAASTALLRGSRRRST